MLRAKTRREVLTVLEDSHFSAANFEVDFGDGTIIPYVDIRFIPNRDFTFSVKPSRDAMGQNIFWTEECPGNRLITLEKHVRKTFNECWIAMSEWLSRIEEEYAHHPTYDEFEEFRAAIEKKLSEHAEDASKHFSRAEAQELVQRLDELSKRITEIEDQIGGAASAAAEQLARDIDTLKADTKTMPRGAWYRKAGSKLVGFLKGVAGSEEGRQFLLEAAKQFFLTGPKN